VPETPVRWCRVAPFESVVGPVGSAIVAGRFERIAVSLVYWSLRRLLELLVLREPVVVVWGTFAQQQVQTNGVLYVSGDRLVPWLREQPPKLSPARVATLTAGVRMLRRVR